VCTWRQFQLLVSISSFPGPLWKYNLFWLLLHKFWKRQLDCRMKPHWTWFLRVRPSVFTSPNKNKAVHYRAYFNSRLWHPRLFPSWWSAITFADRWMNKIGEHHLVVYVCWLLRRTFWSSVSTSWSPDQPAQSAWIWNKALSSSILVFVTVIISWCDSLKWGVSCLRTPLMTCTAVTDLTKKRYQACNS